jgi:hypothetical protein
VIRCSDVVVNEKPCRALLCQSAQRSLRRLLNISFFCHCRTQRHSKARKSTQASCPRFGRTPTNTRIQTSEAVRILDRQRSLSHTAHSLHCGTTDRRLRHSSRLIVHEDRIEAVKLVEQAFVTSLIKSDGSILPFFSRPVAAVLAAMTIAALLWPVGVWTWTLLRRQPA